jgi:hypothetical protein
MQSLWMEITPSSETQLRRGSAIDMKHGQACMKLQWVGWGKQASLAQQPSLDTVATGSDASATGGDSYRPTITHHQFSAANTELMPVISLYKQDLRAATLTKRSALQGEPSLRGPQPPQPATKQPRSS